MGWLAKHDSICYLAKKKEGIRKMDDLTKLKASIGLIVTGLYEKERQKAEGEYFYSKRFIHGINIFHSLNYKYNPKEFDFSKMHEQSFITEYAMKPVSQWFVRWEKAEELELEKQVFYYMDALVGDSGFNTFYVNDNCEDYIAYVERDIIAGIEQKSVYDCLKLLNQNEYVHLRKYFIEHPIINLEDLRTLKIMYSQNNIALQAIENAYEEVMDDCYVCPKCGWTLQKEKIGMRCQSRSCSEAKYIKGELQSILGNSGMLRLKRGVMKYIAVPGQLELEIHNYCNKHKVESVLWPNMDKYDIEITFSNGNIWAIDAKAIREPHFLREQIRQDGGFPDGNYKKGLYVILDEFADARTDYLDIINRELEKIGKTNIRCIRLRDLKKEIRERSEQK